MFRLNPLTRKRLQRFRSLRRGYWSSWILGILLLFCLTAELFINHRAVVVRYEGNWYFPTYGAILPGETFGLGYRYETNYRDLRDQFQEEGKGNWVLMPPVPYGPEESIFLPGTFPPYPPNLALRNFLGTDSLGRDVLARLVYGFRIAIGFSILFLFLAYFIGISLGCAMGYFGGWFDLIGQRLLEIWSNIPFLYIIIIVASVTPPGFSLGGRITILLSLMVLFGWMGLAYYTRTGSYREKSRDYVAAAQVMGASTPRIIFKHLLPNILSTVITFIPFTVVSTITALTALDFLGFGLPPPTPSWGELLNQGISNLHAPWIVSSAFVAMTLVLTLVTFIGESIREAFDPRRFSYYQ